MQELFNRTDIRIVVEYETIVRDMEFVRNN